MYNLTELCKELSISLATGRNWIRLKKLVPKGMRGKSYIFTDEYVEKLKNDLHNGEKDALKSRRNKSFVSGNHLYRAYVSASSKNTSPAEKLLEEFIELQGKIDKAIEQEMDEKNE